MSTWRARKYTLYLNRRTTATLTVRRFRRAPAKQTALRKQWLINIHVGKIKQIVFDLQKKRRRPARRKPVHTFSMRTALASVLIVAGVTGTVYSTVRLTKPPAVPAPAHTFQIKAAPTAAQPVSLPKSTPTHLTIDSQGIDLDITPVGLDSNNSIEMPPLFDWVTGWYNLSPTPGEIGPAIIVGHVDTYKGPSVFWNLHNVQAGDDILINRADGSTVHFKVTGLEQFEQANFPSEKVYGNTAGAELRLITCGGTFNTDTESYTHNTVVFAHLVK